MNEDKGREKYLAACRATESLAKELLKRIAPIDAAGALLATAVDVLVRHLGKETAIRYLRDLAGELADDEYPKVH